MRPLLQLHVTFFSYAARSYADRSRSRSLTTYALGKSPERGLIVASIGGDGAGRVLDRGGVGGQLDDESAEGIFLVSICQR
jgi:hypothetical protein